MHSEYFEKLDLAIISDEELQESIDVVDQKLNVIGLLKQNTMLNVPMSSLQPNSLPDLMEKMSRHDLYKLKEEQQRRLKRV